MKILNLLAVGGTGGIERLCQNIVLNSKEDNRICCLISEGEIYNSLKEKGIKIFSMANYNKNIFKIVNALKEYCMKENIDIVVVHHGGLFCNIIYLLLKKKLKKVRFVRYLHGCFDNYSFGNDGNLIQRKIVRIIMNKALKKSDLIIYISKAVKSSFEKQFDLKNKNAKVIYNGIPERFFSESSNRDTKNNKYINIGYVGRLEKLKGVDILINAYKELTNNNPNLQLTIVGYGTEEIKLKKMITDLNINQNVKFFGKQDNVIPFLDNIDIFVYPSICDEGLGISLIEAMSRGCIPIGFNKGGIPELIEDEKTGFIANKATSQELVQSIQKAIDLFKTEKSKKMQKDVKEFAKQFNVTNTIDQINRELKIILK